MKLVLIGPPGSGKGTQAKLLVERHGLKYIGTGDILREAIQQGTAAGNIAGPLINGGNLAPDDLMNGLIHDIFNTTPPLTQFVLDGYPRTLAQARWFDDLLRRLNLKLDAVLNFVVSDEEVVRRISGRLICPVCRSVYHATDHPPKIAGHCDHEQAVLIQRPDDHEAVVRERLRVFHTNTAPVLAHYVQAGLVHNIQPSNTLNDVYTQMMTALSGRS